MKKYCIAVLALVLTCSVLTGCRGRNQPMETTAPTTAPTTQATTVPTAPATQATQATQSTQPSETMDRGNAPADDSTGSANSGAKGGTNNGAVGGNSGNSTRGNVGSGKAATGEGRSVIPMPGN